MVRRIRIFLKIEIIPKTFAEKEQRFLLEWANCYFQMKLYSELKQMLTFRLDHIVISDF